MAKAGAKRIVDPLLGAAILGCGGSALLAVLAVQLLTRGKPEHIPFVSAFLVLGLAIALFNRARRGHAYRALGIFPWLGLTATIAAAVWLAFGTESPWLYAVTLALSIIGVINAAAYWLWVRRAGAVSWNPVRPVPGVATIGIAAFLTVIAAVVAADGWWYDHFEPGEAGDRVTRGAFAAFAILFATFAWVRLARPAFEWFLAVTFGVMYRVRGKGPGMATCPPLGPVLVIANHGGYFDPPLAEKVIPRPFTGMMTSVYYDKWFVRPIAKYVFRAIRVPHATARREAPEIHEAIAALDRGDCVLIFPEAWLRRKEEVPLKRFGQGVWQILKERPDTPVIACWIEGTWGSFFSFKNGPPMKGKWFDLRRRIRIGVSAPFFVPPDVLANHWDTRFHLMNAVSDARKLIGLESLPRFERSQSDDADA